MKESWRHSAKQCRFARYASCKWSVPLQQCRPREEALTEFEIKTILAITTSTSTSAPIPRQTAAPATTLGYEQFVGKNGGVCDFCKFINIYIILCYFLIIFYNRHSHQTLIPRCHSHLPHMVDGASTLLGLFTAQQSFWTSVTPVCSDDGHSCEFIQASKLSLNCRQKYDVF